MVYCKDTMSDGKVVGGLILKNVKWYITARQTHAQHTAYWANPSCKSCQTDLHAQGDVVSCPNPQCNAYQKQIKLDEPLGSVQTLVVQMWQGQQRKASKDFKWINADQQLVPLAETKADNSDGTYWAHSSFYDTPNGKLLMVLLGKKGAGSKVQLFVKDELDIVAFDQLGDMHPKDLLLGFKAYFSDGSTTETKFPDKAKP